MPFSKLTKYLPSSRKHKSTPSTSEPTTLDLISKIPQPNMTPQTTLLDLPNELLVPILEDVVASIKPQSTIRSGIVQLSWTCRRFHQVMQFFLESTCYVGVSIPVRQPDVDTTAPITVGKAVNISYRLLKYNTKGARGPFVRKLDMYGGFRKTYTEYKNSQKRLSAATGASRGSRGQLGSELDSSTMMLNTVYSEVIQGFNNLTMASIQNTPDSLFVHLIPGLQTILGHCPLLAELKLLLIVSQEKGDDLQNTLKELADRGVSTVATLKVLDISIMEENPVPRKAVPQDSEDNTRSRVYPIEILGKVFGTSIASVRTFKVNYVVTGNGSYSSDTTDAPEKWNMPAVNSLQFPVLSQTTYKFLTQSCEIDYAHIQELTLGGQLDQNVDPNNHPINVRSGNTVEFLRQFSGLRLLKIEALSPRNLPWVYFIFDLDIPSFFPALRDVEIQMKSHIWREMSPTKVADLRISLDSFAMRHGNDFRSAQRHDIDFGSNPTTDYVYAFSVSNRQRAIPAGFPQLNLIPGNPSEGPWFGHLISNMEEYQDPSDME
ncbi:hypothetical protein TWF506_011396 [Arthrobotrys conoides]|uniref:Uncharacterized protein n=1 Tax=Arthrobotrys conoides TaxID=74498 RepID=A0AAN8NAI6_9PEZI